jgi:heat shock protein HslJ
MFSPRSWSNRIVLSLVLATLVVAGAATALVALAQQRPPVQVPPSKPTEGSPMQLTGSRWQWQRSEYSDDSTVVVRDPSRYTLEFLPDGRLAIRADCNQVLGRYSQNGSQLTIELGPSTLVACPPDSQADVFVRELPQVASHVFDGGNLVLNLKVDTGNMIFSPLARPELVGSEWRLVSYNNGRGAVVSVLPEPPASATFTAEGQIHGSAGCNTYRGSYTVSEETLSIGPLATTRMACAPPVMAQEQAFLQALESATQYCFEADRLVLRNAAGAMQAIFTPAGAAGR